MDYLLFAAGLALLLGGGDRLVDAATRLALRLGVSPLTTGVLVVGLGTSLPELVTSLDAALRASPALAVANVVGSNIANVLLVLGLGTLCVPHTCDPGPMRRDLASLVLATAVALLALEQGTVERWMGLVLTGGLAAYLAALLATSRVPAGAAGDGRERSGAAPGVAGAALASALAIAALLAGAHLLVGGALGIAHRHGVSERVIGLTLVAVGTSLPELAVTVIAIVRRRTEVAIGNVIGSNLFNVLGILGVTAVVHPLAVPEGIARFDAWIMLAAALALAAVARTGWRITRAEGAALLLGYPAYLALLAR